MFPVLDRQAHVFPEYVPEHTFHPLTGYQGAGGAVALSMSNGNSADKGPPSNQHSYYAHSATTQNHGAGE